MNTSSDEILFEVIFDVVNNMNVALHLITSQAQRNDVARLNRVAGRKASASVSIKACSVPHSMIANIVYPSSLFYLFLSEVIICHCSRILHGGHRARYGGLLDIPL